MAGTEPKQMLVPAFIDGRKTMVQYESVVPKGYRSSTAVEGAIKAFLDRRLAQKAAAREAELREGSAPQVKQVPRRKTEAFVSLAKMT